MSAEHLRFTDEPSRETKDRVEELIEQMTPAEKVGQMVQCIVDPEGKKDHQAIRSGHVGSILTLNDLEGRNRLQRIAVEESRLGIPLFLGNDVIHGYRTIFPIPLAESCTWDPDLLERAARTAAAEAAACGTDMIFAPMVDVSRDPRWGRIAESSGEDQFLGAEIAKARVRGFQAGDLPGGRRVTACPKHYVAYGACEAGRDYNTVDLSEKTLREIHLAPFQEALEEGAGCLMTAFNEINGVPATGNSFTLREILRSEWGWPCVTLSDYNAIGELIPHGFATDEREAAEQALRAGVDIDMASTAYPEHLQELVEDGTLDVALLDQAVKRVLTLKVQLGLFDDPYVDERLREQVVLSESHRQLAREVAHRSMVLLQNRNAVLPLDDDQLNIAVIGPLAEDRAEMIGCWAPAGEEKDSGPSVFEALRDTSSDEVEVKLCEGTGIRDGSETGLAEAKELASEADVAVLVLGESADMSGEAHCRTELGLPGRQAELLQVVSATGTPTVAVIVSGRPLVLTDVADHADAVLQAWDGGHEAGQAAADILLGRVNPSGKLTASFPRSEGQIPVYHSQKNTGRPLSGEGTTQFDEAFKSGYIDSPNSPLFSFGFGLSYTTFNYSDLTVERPALFRGDSLVVSATVTNEGHRAGEEIVQLYVRDLVGSTTRPVKQLRGFERIALEAGESRTVRFDVPFEDLGFYDPRMDFVVEPGKFKVWVGPSSEDGLEGEFRVEEGLRR